MTIKNNKGFVYDLSDIKSGTLHALASFEDYGIKAGRDYKIHTATDPERSYFFASGEIDLNGELRQDVCDQLIWTPCC